VNTPLRAAFYTLGCKVNQYETSALEQQFAARGFTIVDTAENADVYVLNSCTVTAQGDKKSRQLLRRFRRQNPGAVVVLCGCFPQAFPREAEAIPEADIVVGSTGRSRLAGLVEQRLKTRGERAERLVSILPHHKGEIFEPLRVEGYSARTRAFVKIQDGCERYCAYCIIPTARGPVRSKPLEDLRPELQGLAEAGYREVVLVGINLSSYGTDLGLRLLDAVRLACSVPGIHRVRLGSLEPELLTPEDIGQLARLPKLCPQFHLSLQSGCDETLKRMRRHYNTALYRRIVRDLRGAFPGCAITTDIMVGFPGETGGEFAQSLDFAREIGFARAHVFAYSKRPGTLAAKLEGQIEEPVKASRSKEMIAATDTARRAFLQSQAGTQAEVLLETKLPDGRWEGHTPNYTPVRVEAPDGQSGRILPVRITGAEQDWCVGGG